MVSAPVRAQARALICVFAQKTLLSQGLHADDVKFNAGVNWQWTSFPSKGEFKYS